MKRKALREISVTTVPEAEEAVGELMSRLFQRATAIYTNAETKVSRVSVYCERQTEWTRSKHAALRKGLKEIEANVLKTGAANIAARRVAPEDWAESWKRHFKAIEIGKRLLVKPSWIKRAPKRGQALVVLDPGLSFGTGNHPTTAFCLRELAEGRQTGTEQSFWDVGTGTGILAIAAVKLGYRPVQAMDFDPEAVRVAKENARQNRVLGRLEISRQDLTRLPAGSRVEFDFICANLISTLLVDEKKRIVNRLRRGGRLVVAGILGKEFHKVREEYEALGLKLVNNQAEGEWESGAFDFKSGASALD